MSQINRIKFDLGKTKYDDEDREDREDREYDNQENDDNNPASEYDSWEDMYIEDIKPEEELYIEEVQPEEPLTSEEVAVLKSLEEANLQAKKKPTDTDMDAAYNNFIAQVEAEKKEKEDMMISEISIWVSNGNQVKGETLEEHYTYMTEQKIVQEKERKETEENDRKEQAKKAEQALINARNRRSFWDLDTTQKQKPRKTRAPHLNGPNKLGHLQGEKKQLRKKQLEASEKMKVVEDLQSKNRLQDLLAEEAKKKKTEVLLENIKEEQTDEKIDEEEEEYFGVGLKEESQLCNLIKEVLQTKKETEKKKKQEKDSWKKVEKKEKKILPAVAVSVPKQKQNQYYTMLCKSITNSGLGKCPHGAKCRFAHGVEQLVQTECAFGLKCRFAKQVNPGVFCNNQNKLCTYWHPEETVNSYSVRIGLKHVVSVSVPVSVPVSDSCPVS